MSTWASCLIVQTPLYIFRVAILYNVYLKTMLTIDVGSFLAEDEQLTTGQLGQSSSILVSSIGPGDAQMKYFAYIAIAIFYDSQCHVK